MPVNNIFLQCIIDTDALLLSRSPGNYSYLWDETVVRDNHFGSWVRTDKAGGAVRSDRQLRLNK